MLFVSVLFLVSSIICLFASGILSISSLSDELHLKASFALKLNLNFCTSLFFEIDAS